ncbi:MAG: outer membrane protein assembly factor BamA [Desulfobacterales bacterium]|nr:outer membrane protein assembly factor BamA [Desulfobacterales bacterium]
MIKRLMLLLATMLLAPLTVAWAGEAVPVMVVPFTVHADQDIAGVDDEIQAAMEKELTAEGADIVKAGPVDADMRLDSRALRELGLQGGGDYVVWGSLTWIAGHYSIDARLMETVGNAPPKIFFSEGRDRATLLQTINALSKNMGRSLFNRERIADIEIQGNSRIEADAIRRILKTRAGDIFSAKSLSQDLKAVFAMGYFDDVRIESESGPDGKTVIFQIKEKPTIRYIKISGNDNFKDEEIKESLTLKTGSIMNLTHIRNNVELIERMYKDKNYHNVRVEYETVPLDNNQADLTFKIEEGDKIRIKNIIFEGNEEYDDDDLKDLMETSEKGFFSFLTSSGDLKPEVIEQDAAKIAAFYQNNGYIQARVSDPQIDYNPDGIDITIKIDEGPRFKVGDVTVEGDLAIPRETLMEKLKITKEEYYSRETVREDVLRITDLFADEGYAYADVSPRIDKNTAELKVHIAYVVQKGKQVYFEKIIISGNTKTRDKVIRRELKVYEEELYSGKDLKKGVRALHRLDFFEDVKVDTIRGSGDDKMILKLSVTEKPTGAFTFGGGYSTTENGFVAASVSQRNLFGRGQVLQLKSQLGGSSSRYTLSFTEPWLFDIPLSAGVDLYNWNTDYDTYDKDSLGGGLRFSYPVADFTRVYLNYAYDSADIRDVTADAADSVKDLEGINVTSSVTTALKYDSRDRAFNPTEGSEHSASVEYAGLGGNIGFTKYLVESGKYFPLFWETVGFLHGRAGFVSQNTGKTLPDYEKFYLGGINSMRGFEWEDLAPLERNLDGSYSEVGGEKFVQFNVEYIIPLAKEAGVMGVLFFDTGDVYSDAEDIDLGSLRESAGFGFRWYSPVGPIRVEYGYVLDPLPGQENTGKWEFTMGAAF